MKKWIAAVVVVVIVIAAAVWYKAGSAPAAVETPETAATPAPVAAPVPAATPAPTATPETAATPEPTPVAAETTSDTGEKYEVSPGVYSDGTTRELTSEEWESLTEEESKIYMEARGKEAGFQSWDDLDHVTEEEAQDAIDSFNPDNPYIQDIINSGVLDN
ncbi:MAG TPA: hypothetical protein H9860_11070 [Candidatus Gemmiger faecavium]|nr:hypothetical protein [Candidatus Gemmiger faecavium]